MRIISSLLAAAVAFIFTDGRFVSTIETKTSEFLVETKTTGNRSFVIDYANNRFLKDGQPFRYVSGEIHYFRIPRAYWQDRLWKYRAAGLNAITMYVEWSSHEPEPGNYLFTGEQDVEYFIQLATELGFFIIFRPGPFICAERDLGGMPSWLMSEYPNIIFRTNNTDFEYEVKKWMDVLMPKMAKYMYFNGGPIIMIQIENEYGLLTHCNSDYKLWMRNLIWSYVQDEVVLFTVDPTYVIDTGCGIIPGVYSTVDFGTTQDPAQALQKVRRYDKNGPLICSEFYTGWISAWGHPRTIIYASSIINASKRMLDMGASFSYYMFHGGTNFGFKNGANTLQIEFEVVPTSYDYTAPLNEAGDPTQLYYDIRNLLSKYFQIPNIPIPSPSLKDDYGAITLAPILSLFDYQFISDAGQQFSYTTKTFEELNLRYGYMLYETRIPTDVPDPAILDLSDLRDRATIYLDHNCTGVLSRENDVYSLSLMAPAGKLLSILVENQGRIGVGYGIEDKKGLQTLPKLNQKSLYFWHMTKFPFTDLSWVKSIPITNKLIQPPAFYACEFILNGTTNPLDTFIDFTGWGKGVAFINGFNLGRYWPLEGPQITLYLPGCYLNPSPRTNVLIIFEMEKLHSRLQLNLIDSPILDRLAAN